MPLLAGFGFEAVAALVGKGCAERPSECSAASAVASANGVCDQYMAGLAVERRSWLANERRWAAESDGLCTVGLGTIVLGAAAGGATGLGAGAVVQLEAGRRVSSSDVIEASMAEDSGGAMVSGGSSWLPTWLSASAPTVRWYESSESSLNG